MPVLHVNSSFSFFQICPKNVSILMLVVLPEIYQWPKCPVCVLDANHHFFPRPLFLLVNGTTVTVCLTWSWLRGPVFCLSARMMRRPLKSNAERGTSISLLVFYTWLAVVAVMLVLALLIAKHRHRVSDFNTVHIIHLGQHTFIVHQFIHLFTQIHQS